MSDGIEGQNPARNSSIPGSAIITNNISPKKKKTLVERIKENRQATLAVSPKDAVTGKEAQSEYARKAKHFKSITQILGYKAITNDKNHFLVCKDRFNRTIGLAEILKVRGAGISGMSEDVKNVIIQNYWTFLRQFPNDINFIALPLPNDTKAQQRVWEQQLANCQSKVLNETLSETELIQTKARIELIKEDLNELKNVGLFLINQGFFMIILQSMSQNNANVETGELKNIFKQTSNELRRKVDEAFSIDRAYPALNLVKISREKKEELLKRINNPMTIT